MTDELIISVMIFASVSLLFLGIYDYLGYLKTRLDLIGKIRSRGAAGEAETGTTAGKGNFLIDVLLKQVAALGSLDITKPTDNPAQLSLIFQQAGFQSRKAPVIFYGFKALLAALMFAAFLLLKIFTHIHLGQYHFLLLSVISCLLGYYTPSIWLKQLISKRKERILHAFPDALDLLVVCVEAGTGLDAALARVGEEIRIKHNDLSCEFKLVHLAMKAGKTRMNALKDLAARTGLEDIKNLVTLLLQTEKFGTGIAQALRVHSDFMRSKRYQRAEEIAAKVPIKMLFPLIFFIFPTLFIVILGPAAIRLMRTFSTI